MMFLVDRRTTVPPAPSLWSRVTRTIRATWIHDPVARAFVIAPMSFVAFLSTLAILLTWPTVAIPVVGTVGAGMMLASIGMWVRS